MIQRITHQHRLSLVSKAALLSVSYAALGWLAGGVRAQSPGVSQVSQLPPIQVEAPSEARRRAGTAITAQRAVRPAQRRRSQTARRPEPQAAPKTFGESQDARTATVGVYADSTSSATKTNAPLVNIPQSVSVVTKNFIRDQSFRA
jgi:catecholate siderophore receptor